MAVITISNEYGAAGHEIGRALAEKLGIEFLDKEIIHNIALSVNVSDAQVEEFEAVKHSKLKSFFSTIFDLDALKKEAHIGQEAAEQAAYDENENIPFQFQVDGWIDSNIYKNMIVKVMSALADRGDVVVAGRGGQKILKDHPGTLHLRFVADFEDRVASVVESQEIEEQEAREMVHQMGSRSRDYLRFYFDLDPDKPNHYDLVVNTSRVTVDQAVELVEKLLACK